MSASRTPTAATVQRPVRPRLPENEEIDGTTTPPATQGNAQPMTPTEAERRFYARYGWSLVQRLLGEREQPSTVADWINAAEAVRDALAAPNDTASVSARLEAVVTRLERLQQAAPKSNGGRVQHPPAVFNGQGAECCPYHPDRPLVEGQYGSYCSAKGGPHPNQKGYCGWRAP